MARWVGFRRRGIPARTGHAGLDPHHNEPRRKGHLGGAPGSFADGHVHAWVNSTGTARKYGPVRSNDLAQSPNRMRTQAGLPVLGTEARYMRNAEFDRMSPPNLGVEARLGPNTMPQHPLVLTHDVSVDCTHAPRASNLARPSSSRTNTRTSPSQAIHTPQSTPTGTLSQHVESMFVRGLSL